MENTSSYPMTGYTMTNILEQIACCRLSRYTTGSWLTDLSLLREDREGQILRVVYLGLTKMVTASARVRAKATVRVMKRWVAFMSAGRTSVGILYQGEISAGQPKIVSWRRVPVDRLEEIAEHGPIAGQIADARQVDARFPAGLDRD